MKKSKFWSVISGVALVVILITLAVALTILAAGEDIPCFWILIACLWISTGFCCRMAIEITRDVKRYSGPKPKRQDMQEWQNIKKRILHHENQKTGNTNNDSKKYS